MASFNILGLVSFLICITLVPAAIAENFTTNIVSGAATNLTGDWIVGNTGSFNYYEINSGGSLTNEDGIIGNLPTAKNNTVLITDANSYWENANVSLDVGATGSVNRLIIQNGGRVLNPLGYIGHDAVSFSNKVLVTGTNSRWSNTQTLTIGYDGSYNQLIVTNGGRVENPVSVIGFNSTAVSNTVTVSGTNTVWSNSNNLYLGYSGSASGLIIEDGGNVSVTGGFGSLLGRNAGSVGNRAIVKGTNSVWSNSGTLSVGVSGGTNSLTIRDGGIVSNATANVGSLNGGGGNTVLVTGTNALWNNSGTLFFGRVSGGNQLTITNGGLVRANAVIVGAGAGATGNLIDISGGTLLVSNFSANASLDLLRATVALNSGTLTADRLMLTNGASSVSAFKGGTLNTRTTFVTNGTAFVVGDGTNSATLNLLAGTHSFGNGLTVSSNANLTGTGTINANTISAGTISPGTSAGKLNVIGALTLQSSSVLSFELGGYTPGTQHDFIGATGNVTLDGQLNVSLISGFENTITNGAGFTVLTGGFVAGVLQNVASGARLGVAGGVGDFLVTYGPAALVLSDYRDQRDSDMDGLPNWWEQAYFGSTTGAAAGADDDGDGYTNAQEYSAGTNPLNPASALRIVAVQTLGNDQQISFTSALGKSYAVEWKSDLGNGLWNPVAGSENVAGTGSNVAVIDTNGATQPRRYYRVRLVQ